MLTIFILSIIITLILVATKAAGIVKIDLPVLMLFVNLLFDIMLLRLIYK